MPKEKLIIRIPKPCSENWEAMSPADKGRFCAACQKVVVDYTALSDAELLATIKVRKEPGCGRYLSSQLGREIEPQTKPLQFGRIGIFKRAAAALLFLQTIATTTWAQRTQARTTQQADNGDNAANKGRTIRGCVIDAITNEPLCGIEVQVKGTDIKSITGIAGTFALQLPDTFSSSQLTLVADYAESSGMEPDGTIILQAEVNVDNALFNADVNLYRYASDQLQYVKVSGYRRPMLMEKSINSFVTGGEEVPVQPKPRKWFPKKHKLHE